MLHTLIFDIETRHDTDLMRRLSYQPKDGTFAPLIYHLPCAIAVGHLNPDGVLTSVESLGESGMFADDPEALTEAFWSLASGAPILVSFNGRGFDLPVMELCGLRYGCCAPKHWTSQYGTRYRYSKEHHDLLDILSNYGGATKGLSLANLVQLLGYKGKDGMGGAQVQEFYDAGKLEEIQAYNRLDIIRTYAVWLAWARISGRLTPELYQAATTASKTFLDQIR